MPPDKIIIKSRLPSQTKLPGTISLPDGTQPVQLGSGTITSLISSGGMALVYEIWNSELEVKRAVKLLHPDHSRESEERFYTEMKISAKLHHPNIVDIYGVGRWNGLPFIEMERIDGVTLEELISRFGSLPPEVCTALGVMVGRALNYAHNQSYVIYGKKYKGIIHRDLKPGNIMITREGVVKLMDFGIARPITASIHTCEGTVVGTMQYLAPEQLDGSPTDARSDIYSLGTVLYEAVTGIRAFPEVNITKLVPDKLANNFVPLEDFNLKTPQALCNLVHRCMRYEQDKRVQSMLEYLRAMGHLHKNLSPQLPEVAIGEFLKQVHREKKIASIYRRHRKRTAAAIWAIAAVLVVAAAGLGYVQYGEKLPGIYDSLVARFTKEPAVTTTTRVESLDTEGVAPLGEPDAVEDFPVSTEPPSPVIDQPESGHGHTRTQVKEPPAQKTTVNPSASPQRKRPENRTPPPSREPSLIEMLAARYGTSDPMELFSSEVARGNFSTALKVYPKLPLSDALKPKAIIYRIRAAKGARDSKTLAETLNRREIHDGEFYLEKAQFFFRKGQTQKTRNYLDKAAQAPTNFMDPMVFRRKLLYGKGLCASAQFNTSPTEETRREAMTAWYEVKSLLRTSPEHPYFQKADQEIRRVNKREVARK